MTARGPRVLVVDDQPKTADFLRRHAPDLVLLGPPPRPTPDDLHPRGDVHGLVRRRRIPGHVVNDERRCQKGEEQRTDTLEENRVSEQSPVLRWFSSQIS